MPRCFMAKKLKYPYEQWKEQQQRSRSPSPPATDLKVEPSDDDINDVSLNNNVRAGKLCKHASM